MDKEKQFYEQEYDTPAVFLDEPFDVWRMKKIIWLGRSRFDEADLFSCRRVLNVGCGRGREAKLILWHEPAHLFLADFAHVQVRHALAYLKAGPRVSAFCASGEKLPLKDKSADICFIEEALHHFGDPMAGVREMIRVARSYVVIDEPRKGLLRELLNRLFVFLRLKEDLEHGHLKAYRFGRKEVGQLKAACTKVACYPYFYYSFVWYSRTRNPLLKKSYLFFLYVLNTFFHRFGNKVLIIAQV